MRGHVVGSAGKQGGRAGGNAVVQREEVNAETLAGRRSHERNRSRRRARAGLRSDRRADADWLAVGDAGRREICKRRRAGRKGGSRPVVDEVVGVDRSQAGRHVIARGREPGRVTGIIGIDQHSKAPASRGGAAIWRIGIAWHRVIALRDVVKDAGISRHCHRRGITARAALCRQLVENVVGITLPRTQSLRCHLLIDERHDASESWSRGRGSTDAHKGVSCQAAGLLSTKEARISLADDVEAVVEAVAREQRDIGQVAHSIGRHSGSGLPRGLAVAREAGAAAVLGGATAGATTSADDIQVIAVIRALANSEAGAGIVPGGFRDVRLGGSAGGGVVGRVPVSGGSGWSLVEIGAA